MIYYIFLLISYYLFLLLFTLHVISVNLILNLLIVKPNRIILLIFLLQSVYGILFPMKSRLLLLFLPLKDLCLYFCLKISCCY